MSWNDMMKRLVMGKGTNKNYSAENLPHNRKQVLKFAYKNRRTTILGVNLIACLFALPFILFELWTIVVNKMYVLDFKTATEANSYALTQYYLRIPFLMIIMLQRMVARSILKLMMLKYLIQNLITILQMLMVGHYSLKETTLTLLIPCFCPMMQYLMLVNWMMG